MIIGAIEAVRADRVTGWIHCHAADLEDATVLAFVDRRCVGGGRVGLHRADLEAAGLLHGRLGFDFPIALDSPEEAGRVVVSLDRCEAVILQRGSAVLGAAAAARAAAAADGAGPVAGSPPPREVAEWLRAQGAIRDAEFDLLEGLTDYGVAVWQPDAEGGPAGRGRPPRDAARHLFSVCAMRAVEAAEAEVADPHHLEEILAAPAGGDLARAGLLAFHAARPVRLRVLEGSHRRAAASAAGEAAEAPHAADPATAGLEYPVGPDALLLLHRDCRFAAEEFNAGRRLRLLYPVERPAD